MENQNKNYYQIEECYRKESDSEEWVNQIHKFDKGSLLECKQQALNFFRARAEEHNTGDKSFALNFYKTLNLGYEVNELPEDLDDEDFEITCSLIT